MAIDPDVAALQRLAERSDDELLALAGLPDASSDRAADAMLRILDPSLAASLEEDGLLPRFSISLQQARENGRARVAAYIADRRERLQATICPLAKSEGADRDLIVTIGPALLADAVVQSGGEPTAMLMAMIAYLLTRSIDELCADWDPPIGSSTVLV